MSDFAINESSVRYLIKSRRSHTKYILTLYCVHVSYFHENYMLVYVDDDDDVHIKRLIKLNDA